MRAKERTAVDQSEASRRDGVVTENGVSVRINARRGERVDWGWKESNSPDCKMGTCER